MIASLPYLLVLTASPLIGLAVSAFRDATRSTLPMVIRWARACGGVFFLFAALVMNLAARILFAR